jgi:hypothetical protein
MNPLRYQVDQRYTITRSPEPLPMVMAGSTGEVIALFASAALEGYGAYMLAHKLSPKHPGLATLGMILGIVFIKQAI